MWIKSKNIDKMKPDEKTIEDYEKRLSDLRNIAMATTQVNSFLQADLKKANETIDELRKEITKLVTINYEQSKRIIELNKKDEEYATD